MGLSTRTCAATLGPTASCSWLTVPANRAERGHGTIRLPIAVIPGRTPSASTDAVVIPAGGPGYAGLPNSIGASTEALTLDHDVVLLDQRGTGLAEPSLNCPELEKALVDVLTRADPYATEAQIARNAATACRARLVAGGVHLEDYNTVSNAADLVDLRRALGYERWNILGVSYGSRLALQLLRVDAAATKAVILDSVYPPTVGGLANVIDANQRGLDAYGAWCATSASCRSAVPDAKAMIDAIVARYDAAPATVSVLAPGGGLMTTKLTGADLIGGLIAGLYDTNTIRGLALLLPQLAAGQSGLLSLIVPTAMERLLSISEGMALSVDCADNAGSRDAARDAAVIANPGKFATIALGAGASMCDVWDVPPTGPGFNDPVRSDVPVLIMAGSIDPITPPAAGRAAAATLTRSQYVERAGSGHGLFTDGSCPRGIGLAFLKNPLAPVEGSCLGA